MKTILSILLLAATFVCSGQGNPNDATGIRMMQQVTQNERGKPTVYIKTEGVNGEYHLEGPFKGFKRNGYVIKGTIHSTAVGANFKDIRLVLKFYAASGTLLETRNFTEYQHLAPGKTIAFEIVTTMPPAGYDEKTYSVAVAGATFEY